MRSKNMSRQVSPGSKMFGIELLKVFSKDLFGLFPEANMCFEKPYIAFNGPIFGIRTKPGCIFDDTFWDLFHTYPFHICHVAWLPEEEVFEMRFGLNGVKRLVMELGSENGEYRKRGRCQ